MKIPGQELHCPPFSGKRLIAGCRDHRQARHGRGNDKALIPTVFATQRDGFIAQTQRGYHALFSLFVLACGTLTVGRLLCLFLAPQVVAAHGRGALRQFKVSQVIFLRRNEKSREGKPHGLKKWWQGAESDC